MIVLTLCLLVFFSSLFSPAASQASVLMNPHQRILPPPPVRGVRPRSKPEPVRNRATASASNAPRADNCPPEAVEEFGEEYFKTYGDYCFMFMTHKKEYYDNAVLECLTNGGLLAMPKTQDLLNFLSDELTNTFNVNGPVWIGMSDVMEEGTMRWADGSSVQYRNFDAYTHGWFGELEDCVALDTRDKLFHDYPCNGIFGRGKKAFVCQYGKKDFSWFKPIEYWDID